MQPRDYIGVTYTLLSLQAEDRAIEANKTCNRLQKDVDRIEGLSVNSLGLVFDSGTRNVSLADFLS